ncbi:sarcosine oxidase subunit gamma [uncultured Jatrophihabitans sp.]|uniref:sarcosine oxidase subunit gamma n=1 Tax=uncultured Jatrophihabitans sp. TaxID=1610747 RepID=UPI0035CBFAE6
MTAETLAPQSPLAGWQLTGDGVTGRERPLLGQLSVRTSHDLRRLVLGSDGSHAARRRQPERVLRLGPDEWLVLTTPAERTARGSSLQEFGVVTDVSAQRTTIELTGPRARDLLARGCAIDLEVSVAPVGSCYSTLLAQTGVIIVVDQQDEILLLVRSSFASYLARWLEDACTDLS